jgi:hypothetical protein
MSGGCGSRASPRGQAARRSRPERRRPRTPADPTRQNARRRPEKRTPCRAAAPRPPRSPAPARRAARTSREARARPARPPPADHGRAAGERADALRDAERVAADDTDLVRSDAELAGSHLGQRRLEPLPLRRHAGEYGDAPGGVGADGCALEGTDAGQLDVARDADAEQAALLAGAQAVLRELIPSRHLQRAAQHRRVIATVVDDVAGAAIVGQAGVVRHVCGLHEVGEADGGAVAAGLAGD